jgi:uncharacterized protein with FMN-binding domain
MVKVVVKSKDGLYLASVQSYTIVPYIIVYSTKKNMVLFFFVDARVRKKNHNNSTPQCEHLGNNNHHQYHDGLHLAHCTTDSITER